MTHLAPEPLILIMEEERDRARPIARHVARAGMQTRICHRAADATRFLQRHEVSLMLIDISWPEAAGQALLAALRRGDLTIPAILLTEHDPANARVQAREFGKDEATPSSGYAELIALVRAVALRRPARDDHRFTPTRCGGQEPFEVCGGQVDPARLEIRFDETTVKIGRKELGILAYLHEHAGLVITRKALIHAIWGRHADIRSRSLDQYIGKVRNLFNRHGRSRDSFRTVHGVGYILDLSGQASPEVDG